MAIVVMLVWHKDPLGYTQIGTKRVYGKCFSYGSFGPTSITRNEWRSNRDILIECPITTKWLENKFGAKFPSVSFTTSRMQFVNSDNLIAIVRAMGIDYKAPKGELNTVDRRGLQRTIVRLIEE